jgi:hypothetical protein
MSINKFDSGIEKQGHSHLKVEISFTFHTIGVDDFTKNSKDLKNKLKRSM